MATIQIRNLSDDAVRVFKVRAAANGQSLQEYMRTQLEDAAVKPTKAEIVAAIEHEIAARPIPLLRSPAELIREARDEHDADLARRMGFE